MSLLGNQLGVGKKTNADGSTPLFPLAALLMSDERLKKILAMEQEADAVDSAVTSVKKDAFAEQLMQMAVDDMVPLEEEFEAQDDPLEIWMSPEKQAELARLGVRVLEDAPKIPVGGGLAPEEG